MTPTPKTGACGLKNARDEMTQWKLVPVEPTEEMVEAARKSGAEGTAIELANDYKAMLAAAPEPAPQVFQCQRCSTSMEVDESAKPSGASPLPDDVAAMVDRLRNRRSDADPVDTHEPADMLERLALELATLRAEADPEALSIAHEYGYQRGKEAMREELAAVKAERDAMNMALQNCRLFAARNRKEDWALLILGFCAEGGVAGSVTR